MESYKIVVSKSFHRDLKNIIEYILYNFDSPYTASTFLDEIENTVNNLSAFPYRHSVVDDEYLKHKEFRKILIKNYIIFYKVDEENKAVLIHRILHSKQNWLDIL